MQEQDRPQSGGDEPAADTPPPASPPPASQPPPPPPAADTPPPAEPTAAGAPGLVYADVPNRAIAYIIDAIILFVINLIVGIVLGAIVGPTVDVNFQTGEVTTNFGATLLSALVSTAISGLYFIYTWTSMRGSPGQKVLGMQVSNAADGATITMDQAIKRWIFLGAPFGIASAVAGVGFLGVIIGLAALAYFIYLLVSTAQSPTKQGFHDKQANTIVVKSARSVA